MKTFVCNKCQNLVCVCAVDDANDYRKPQHCVMDGTFSADFHEGKDAKETKHDTEK